MKYLKAVPFVAALIIMGAYILTTAELPLEFSYDILMNLRPPLEAPPDLVVIDTKDGAKDYLSSDDTVRVLTILSAMDSRLAVFQTNVGLPDEYQRFSNSDRQQLVHKEFSRIQKNITNLFDGIRLGSVRPQDASRYVQDINGLVEESKNRILLTLAESGNTSELELEKARALFNRVILCDDLLWGDSTGGALEVWGGQAVYSRVDRDSDGIVRRMFPVKELPNKKLIHAGLALLISSIGGDAALQRTETAWQIGTDRVQYELPLDTRGRLLLQRPDMYKTISFKDIIAYQDQEKKLYETFKEMERSGYFIHLDALQYPTTLYEYAKSLEIEILESPLEERVWQWREARNAFYRAASDVLQGPAERAIIQGYDELLAAEALEEGGKERIRSLKELASQAFSWARKAHDELLVLHSHLESTLRNTYCIIGSTSGDADATVALLSTILSRSFIHPGKPYYLFLANTVLLLLLYSATMVFTPPLFFIFSLVITIISFLGTAGLFVIGGYWYAPLLPVSVVLGTAILYELEQSLVLLYMRRHQELALKERMTPAAFKGFVRGIPLSELASVPTPLEIQEADALILCVRHASFVGDEPPVSLKDFAKNVKLFRQKASDLIMQQGGTILWMDGEVLFAAFGFPFRNSVRAWKPAKEALDASRAVFAAFDTEPVTAGMDYGTSAFYYDVLSGYSALGRVSIHARVLSGLAGRYGVRLLCTEGALNVLQTQVDEPLGQQSIDTLVDKQEGRDIRFYAISDSERSGS